MSLASNIQDFALRVATESKALRTLLNGNQPTNGALATTAKGNLVAAINELKSQLDVLAGEAAGIDDGATTTANTWSATKILAQLEAYEASIKADILGGASGAYDTLKELETLLTGQGSALNALTTSIGNKVSWSEAQTIDATGKARARTNIGAASADDVGSTTTNFVTTFESGLV